MSEHEFDKFEGFAAECEVGILPKKFLPAVKKLREIVQPYDEKIYFFAKIDDNTILKSHYHYSEYDLKVELYKAESEAGYIIENVEYPLTAEIEETLELKELANSVKGILGYGGMRDDEIEVNSKEELIAYLRNELSRRDEAINTTNLKVAKLFFDKSVIDYNEKLEYNKYSSRDAERITAVYEKDNMRVALTRGWLVFAMPEHRHYNYLDKDRIFYHDYREGFFFFDMALPINRVEKFLQRINYRDFESQAKIYFDLADIETFENNKQVKERLEKEKQKSDESLYVCLKKELEKNGFIMNSGIKIYKEGFIEFNGMKIGKSGYDVSHLIHKETLDFNEIFNRFCSDFLAYDNEEVWLGKFSVKLTQSDSCRYYIDNIRINKSEVVELLKRGLCFDKKEDYYNLLTEVSKCSIRIHNALCSGILIKVRSHYINRGDDTITLKLTITRDKNRHSIVYENGKKAGIKNINALFGLSESERYWKHDFAGVRKILIENTYLAENEVNNVLAEGFAYYKEALKRSEELLAETIKVLGVEQKEHNCEQAYIVKGKLKTYLVTEKLKIYEYPAMRYICVIDRGRADNVVGKDKLVSRLYALSNDNLVIDDIHTLK